MRISVLGDLEVEIGGAVADLGGPKPRTLLALLVAAEGRPVPVETLTDQIWGDDPPARVEASLQSYVARLRRALEPERAVRRPAERLRTRAGGYALDVAADDVDARRFTALLREARRLAPRDPHTAADLLAEALAAWKGDAYSGLDATALRGEATRLDELRLGALEDLWRIRIDAGGHVEAAAELEHLVSLHPLREQLWGLLALALYRAARQGDALAALRRAREHLAEELGVDPGVDLRRLEDAILQQDPGLAAPSDVPTTLSAAPAPEPEEPRAAPGPRLFGREAAFDEASTVLAAAAEGRGRTILVSGEPGIGKTALAEALLARAGAAGFRCGRGSWEAEAGPPLWGWTRAVGQLLGSDDLLRPDPGGVTDAASASFRQAAALLDELRDGPPSLVVLDDVHWADAESVRLLRRLVADVASVPLVLVLTVRTAPAEITEAVADLLAALARLDPLRLELAGLPPEAIASWVAEHTGLVLRAEVAAELARRSDGNPFFVTELTRLLVSEGALSSLDATGWRAVPRGVRDVVRHRLAQLPEVTASVLGWAAVLGRSFHTAVVEEASGLSAAEVDEAVESAQVLGLVDEESPGTYRFTHALVRDVVHEAVAAPVRARRHAEVAAVLEAHHGGRVAQHAAELAEHYRLAGPAHARSGWVFAARAGELAAAQSAHDEALRQYDVAARLQDLDPVVDDVDRERVLLGRARALIGLARPIEAWPHVAQAARSAMARDDAPGAAAALLTITDGLVWGWRTHPEWDDDAIGLWETVLDAQPPSDGVTRAPLQAALAAELLCRPGATDRATRLADEAVQLVRRAPATDRQRLRVLRLAVMAWLRPELLHRRLGVTDEIIELAGRVGDPGALAAALTGRAGDRAELGRLGDAHTDVLRAHDLAERHHLSQNWMVSGWCLATRRHLDEDWDGAESAVAELEAFQATLAMSGQGIGLCQVAMTRELQGRLPELEPALREAAGYHPAFRELHALALVRQGDVTGARLALGPWSDQPQLTRDYLWLTLTVLRAWTWLAIGDEQARTDLRAELAPYADRLAVTLPVAFAGSVRLTLGELALAAGDLAEAGPLLHEARGLHAELGLPAWVARSDAALARWRAATPPAGPDRGRAVP